MARTCPNDCNCGQCPLEKEVEEEGMFSEIMDIPRSPTNLSSISLTNQNRSDAFLSIKYVIPLRDYGVIIRWNVLHHLGIRGYKIFIDGMHVASVHSPSRTSALIENVNMRIPHHFSITAVTSNVCEKMPTILYHNTLAVYLYKPNNFIC